MCFFMAHTLFWYFGTFNSAGLIRVFVGVVPLSAIMAVAGLHFLANLPKPVPNIIRQILKYGFILFVIIYPFSSTPPNMETRLSYHLSKEQKIVNELCDYIEANYEHYFLFTQHIQALLRLDMYRYDWRSNKHIHEVTKKPIPDNSLVLWDDWYAVEEGKVTFEDLMNDPDLKLVKEIQTSRKVALFEKVKIQTGRVAIVVNNRLLYKGQWVCLFISTN